MYHQIVKLNMPKVEDLPQGILNKELYLNCEAWQYDLSIMADLVYRQPKFLGNSNAQLIDLNPQDY